MRRSQFRVLYREFLFRIIDLELLAPQGDMTKLLGQFVALMLIVGLWVLLPVAILPAGIPPSEIALLFTWAAEHFLIATTILAVGLVAVLSWESLFPDRRDVLVLTPLPVRASTLFLAKIAAVATALSTTVLALNLFPSLGAPFSFASALTVPPAKYDAAMAPVSGANMGYVLDRDFTAAREPDGTLLVGKDAGIAIGVLDHGSRNVFTFGTAKPDSIFEIGSITKTFTGLLLAQMAVEGKVRLDEPVRGLLPPGTVTKPPGQEITLLDLVTHHSGLPPMPDNFSPADIRNPYADYHAANLYAYLAKRGVAKRGHPRFSYSNLGVGLLGQALANRAGTTYPKLLQQEITRPLGMNDTAVVLWREQRERFIQGHSANANHDPAHAWDFDALAGAGGIRSNAGDMLTYLEAQLHPEKYPALAAAIRASHQPRDDMEGFGATNSLSIAMAWWRDRDTGIFQHGGGTAGFNSRAFFDPKHDYAAVVLLNTGPNMALNAEQVAEHIRQRLAGERALSLAPPVVPGSGGFWKIVRSFGAYWITLFASAVFVLCFVLTLQGFAQLLPRQIFLRVSSFLQLACFCFFLTIYFFQLPFADPVALSGSTQLLTWLPSYCFFSLFQQLNGPLPSMLAPMAHRAWMGLGFSLAGAALSYLNCYFRTLRMIAEQPDIQPVVRRLRWLPRFGNSLQTAVGQFCVRTLFRSRQHRVILSFYLGIALGLAMFFSKAPVLQEQSSTDIWYQVSAPMAVASILMLCGAVMGARIVFSIPLDLRANWIFRIMSPFGVAECLAASRRALYGMALVPVWSALAIFFLWTWPLRAALEHLLILALVGIIIAELMLHGFQKIPFTCSYLPGKSYFHMALIALMGAMFLLVKGAALERRALEDWRSYVAIIATLTIAAVAARWRTESRARSDEAMLKFEEEAEPVIMGLGLNRDGVAS